MICVRCLDLLRGCYCYDLLAHCQDMIFQFSCAVTVRYITVVDERGVLDVKVYFAKL